jgi:hypothetical protein
MALPIAYDAAMADEGSPFGERSVSGRLEHYSFQMGPDRARLAVAMDELTDAIILLGKHRLYVHEPTGEEKLNGDVNAALNHLEHVKRLLTAGLRAKEVGEAR